MRCTAKALSAATEQLVAKATSNWPAGIPMRASATMCAGKAARMKIHHRRGGVTSRAQNRTTFGGQNGAKILSERVPIRKASSAPR